VECDKDEVWHDIVMMVRPKERSAWILPPYSALNRRQSASQRAPKRKR
jgi:hypothetical protein